MKKVMEGRLGSASRAWTGLLAAYIGVYFFVPPLVAGWMFIALGAVTAAVVLRSTKMHQARDAMPVIANQAFRDDLTGLASRALFLDRVSHALSRRSLDPDHPIAVLFVSLEDTNAVRDSLGCHAGDEFFRAVSERLQGCLRIADTAARLGTDEFGVLVEDMHFPEDAENVAERIIAAMARPFRVDERDVLSTVSIGIAISSTGLSSAEELLHNSEGSMYVARRDGVGYAKYSPNMHAAMTGLMKREVDLSGMIKKDGLEL